MKPGKHALDAGIGFLTGGTVGALKGWRDGVNRDADRKSRNKPQEVHVTVNRTKQQNTTDVDSFNEDNDGPV